MREKESQKFAHKKEESGWNVQIFYKKGWMIHSNGGWSGTSVKGQ